MLEGKVKWYNEKKGYGFIAPDNSADDVFFHVTGLVDSRYVPVKDDQVIFSTTEGKKGLNAIEIEKQ